MCPLVNRCSLQLLNINCTFSTCISLYQTYIQQNSHLPGAYKSVFLMENSGRQILFHMIIFSEKKDSLAVGGKNALAQKSFMFAVYGTLTCENLSKNEV